MKTDKSITAKDLRMLVRYDNGNLYWRDENKHNPIGWPSGKDGRLQCQIGGITRYVHRLVWLYHYGYWPSGQLDHINGDRLDNRIENLREVTASQNSQNRRYDGVQSLKGGRWRARIVVDGKRISLGCFTTRDEAIEAYRAAKLDMHEAYATGIGMNQSGAT